MASVGQTNDTLKNVQAVTFLLFPKPKIRLEDCKALTDQGVVDLMIK